MWAIDRLPRRSRGATKQAIIDVADDRGINIETLTRHRKRINASYKAFYNSFREVPCGQTPDPINFRKMQRALEALALDTLTDSKGTWNQVKAREMLQRAETFLGPPLIAVRPGAQDNPGIPLSTIAMLELGRRPLRQGEGQ